MQHSKLFYFRVVEIFLSVFFVSQTLFSQDVLKLLTCVHGEKEGDEYSKVAALGDVNGDGYNDFIVGSQIKGYAKLYLGGSPFDTNNCIRFKSSEPFTAYNGTFAGRGDLNGDGFKDFVLGAAYDIFQFGKVFIHLGKPTVDTIADLTITGQGYYYFFGARIAINGDLNGDGYDDLVVSAPNDDFDARGRVYIYFGGKEMDSEADVYIEGKEAFDMLGYSIDIAGDVNGDGYDDLLVGVPQILGKNKTGKAYLFFGGNNIGFDNYVEFAGSDSGYSSYGKIVSGLGDINGDGFDDFGIMSDKYADVFLGKENIISSNRACNFEGEFSFIGGLDDIDQDGFDDYVIVRKKFDVYFGANIIDTVSDISLNFWANPIRNLGDINGDSNNEIAFGIGGGWDSRGRVELYIYDKLNSVKGFLINTNSTDFMVNQNYPHPFNPITNIKYKLTRELEIKIEIVDTFGKRVKEIFSGVQPAGEYTAQWDSTNKWNVSAASGVYFVRFTTRPVAGNFTVQQEIIKMVLIK